MEVWSLNHWIAREVTMMPFWSHLGASFLHPERLMKEVMSLTSTQRLLFLLAPTSPVDNPQHQFYLADYTQGWYCCHHENCGAQENAWLTQISQFGSRICCPLMICLKLHNLVFVKHLLRTTPNPTYIFSSRVVSIGNCPRGFSGGSTNQFLHLENSTYIFLFSWDPVPLSFFSTPFTYSKRCSFSVLETCSCYTPES